MRFPLSGREGAKTGHCHNVLSAAEGVSRCRRVYAGSATENSSGALPVSRRRPPRRGRSEALNRGRRAFFLNRLRYIYIYIYIFAFFCVRILTIYKRKVNEKKIRKTFAIREAERLGGGERRWARGPRRPLRAAASCCCCSGCDCCCTVPMVARPRAYIGPAGERARALPGSAGGENE